MFCVNVWLTVRDTDHVPQVRADLAALGRLSRGEPGCLRFEVYQSRSEPAKFLLVERWKDEAAWQQHRTAEGFTTIYAPRVLPVVDRQPHISDLVE